MKTYKTLSTIQQVLFYLLLTTAGVTGFIRGDYIGGIATGFVLATIILFVIGKVVIRKSIIRLEKSMRERIRNTE